MVLFLKRFDFGDNYTIGKLYVNNVFECYTLEDKVRDIKIPNETAIPAGTYKVIVNRSNRFKKDLPLVLNVMNFEGVRIHSGNTDKDTEGCILVGKTWSKGNFIGGSRMAFNSLFPKIQQGVKDGVVILTIE
jgi:hypothetical protein